MAFLEINDGYKAPGIPLDGRTYYDTIQEALADNPNDPNDPDYDPTYPFKTNRFIGQKMVIKNPPNSDSPHEYWFKDGIADEDLVEYDSYEWEDLEPSPGGNARTGIQIAIGSSDTAAGTATKVASLDGYERTVNSLVLIVFANTNTAANPTLNVNNTGEANIRHRNVNLTGTNAIVAGTPHLFQWDITCNYVYNSQNLLYSHMI